MPINLLDNLQRDYESGVPFSEDPSFMKTVGASLAYKYQPFVSRVSADFQFPEFAEDGFVAVDHIPDGYMQYSKALVKATNQEHMDFLVSQIDRSMATKGVLEESGLVAQFGAELFDPVNWLGVPLRGATFLTRAVKGGTFTGVVVAGQEAIRHPLDPTSTTAESAMNIGSSFVVGGLLNGLVGIPAARRAAGIKEGAENIDRLHRAIDPESDEFDAEIADNIFTDTWLYKAVSTPVKRTLQDEDLPNSVKLDLLGLANDNGLLLSGNRRGKALDPSVFILSKLREGEMVQVYDDLMSIHAEASGLGRRDVLDYNPQRKAFEDWAEEIDRKAITGEKAANAYEEKAISRINEFYSTWEARLREQGLIGDAPYFKRAIEYKTKKIDEVEADIQTMKSDAAQRRAADFAARLRGEVDELKAQLDEATTAAPKELSEVFRPRFWDRDAILANREALERIIADWYKENPFTYERNFKTGKWERTELSTDEAMLAGRAKKTVDTILGLEDDDIGFLSVGGSKHFRHRALDIPNSKVLDFIETNPISIMKAYATKVAPRYEFSVKYGGRSIDDMVDEIFIKSLENGATVEKANRAGADFRSLHGIITRSLLRDPDHWSHKVARGMRAGATLSYLGGSGFATITEPAKIMMEHGIGPTMRGLFAVLNDNQLKLGAKEGRIAGEGLETLMGSVIMRISEDMNNNPLRGDLLDRAHNAFFLLNGLGPITRILKDFDAMMRVHTLIDYSVRATKGKATKMELDYLARYGIDLELADRISRKPWQKSESGMYMANTEEWGKLDLDQITKEVSETYSHSSKPIHKMTEEELLEEFGGKFYFDRVITDPEIVRKVMSDRGYPDGLGYSLDFGDGIPNTIYMDFDAIRGMYRKLREKSDDMAKLREDLEAVRERIGEEAYTHKTKLLDNIDIVEDEDAFIRFVFLHELHHSTTKRGAGESLVQYEGRIDDLAYAYMRNEREEGIRLTAEKEYDMRLSQEQDDVTKFRAALSSGILNTILMGTPADKPVIVNGVALIPMRVAGKFGMKEDPKYKGYARVENGLLGLPFQFYSYTLAALNKITVAHAQGQLKNQILGTAIAMGLGYMLLQIRTPNYVEMSFQDQFARSFDYSGVAAIYSDLFYTAMSTSLALGGPNVTGGFLQPRYPVEPSGAEAATGILGAGPSYTYDVGKGVWDMLNGEVSEGSKDLIRNLPFARLWFLKGMVNNMTNALSDRIEQTDGYRGF